MKVDVTGPRRGGRTQRFALPVVRAGRLAGDSRLPENLRGQQRRTDRRGVHRRSGERVPGGLHDGVRLPGEGRAAAAELGDGGDGESRRRGDVVAARLPAGGGGGGRKPAQCEPAARGGRVRGLSQHGRGRDVDNGGRPESRTAAHRVHGRAAVGPPRRVGGVCAVDRGRAQERRRRGDVAADGQRDRAGELLHGRGTGDRSVRGRAAGIHDQRARLRFTRCGGVLDSAGAAVGHPASIYCDRPGGGRRLVCVRFSGRIPVGGCRRDVDTAATRVAALRMAAGRSECAGAAVCAGRRGPCGGGTTGGGRGRRSCFRRPRPRWGQWPPFRSARAIPTGSWRRGATSGAMQLCLLSRDEEERRGSPSASCGSFTPSASMPPSRTSSMGRARRRRTLLS